METNEAIARWMGWRWSDEHGWPMWYAPGEEIQPFATRTGEVPYTESLDAQVPVWEALRDAGKLVVVDSGGHAQVFDVVSLERIAIIDGGDYNPPEAAANAIVAALEALGEVK